MFTAAITPVISCQEPDYVVPDAVNWLSEWSSLTSHSGMSYHIRWFDSVREQKVISIGGDPDNVNVIAPDEVVALCDEDCMETIAVHVCHPEFKFTKFLFPSAQMNDTQEYSTYLVGEEIIIDVGVSSPGNLYEPRYGSLNWSIQIEGADGNYEFVENYYNGVSGRDIQDATIHPGYDWFHRWVLYFTEPGDITVRVVAINVDGSGTTRYDENFVFDTEATANERKIFAGYPHVEKVLLYPTYQTNSGEYEYEDDYVVKWGAPGENVGDRDTRVFDIESREFHEKFLVRSDSDGFDVELRPRMDVIHSIFNPKLPNNVCVCSPAMIAGTTDYEIRPEIIFNDYDFQIDDYSGNNGVATATFNARNNVPSTLSVDRFHANWKYRVKKLDGNWSNEFNFSYNYLIDPPNWENGEGLEYCSSLDMNIYTTFEPIREYRCISNNWQIDKDYKIIQINNIEKLWKRLISELESQCSSNDTAEDILNYMYNFVLNDDFYYDMNLGQTRKGTFLNNIVNEYTTTMQPKKYVACEYMAYSYTLLSQLLGIHVVPKELEGRVGLTDGSIKRAIFIKPLFFVGSEDITVQYNYGDYTDFVCNNPYYDIPNNSFPLVGANEFRNAFANHYIVVNPNTENVWDATARATTNYSGFHGGTWPNEAIDKTKLDLKGYHFDDYKLRVCVDNVLAINGVARVEISPRFVTDYPDEAWRNWKMFLAYAVEGIDRYWPNDIEEIWDGD